MTALTADVQEALYAWCPSCSMGSDVGIMRAEAEAWAAGHNEENHGEDAEHVG
ncbi:hypothetical protein SEA_ROSIEPOSIE_61 [Arthrobacter phage RosiePosie]|uniref:Uncharacterized protein n=4 Tax=Klausavirus princesstrina TaxID=1984784 RepID=A0A286N3K0_9CAUD|nr:hypothetical protein SEA_CHUBSTER_63 [Arthrobacter phage Chubster]AOZ64727.1 hypothetical protein SEA_CHOCOLAT_62 [Arthrobacter phage Chocolat]ASX98957.1 hypothetical protein SEA_ROSIEPOSIE_61 [Arthrobacter phage RosiePosie]ASZ73274.1 hypothetical protein SEA_JAYCOOKIE_63 [Arthrobacter phage JayCookie]